MSVLEVTTESLFVKKSDNARATRFSKYIQSIENNKRKIAEKEEKKASRQKNSYDKKFYFTDKNLSKFECSKCNNLITLPEDNSIILSYTLEPEIKFLATCSLNYKCPSCEKNVHIMVGKKNPQIKPKNHKYFLSETLIDEIELEKKRIANKTKKP